MQTIGNLEVPEIKYYRDAYGDQHESSFLCRELDNYGHEYFDTIKEPEFSKYGKYNKLSKELYKSCNNPYKVIEWLDEELFRVEKELKVAWSNFISNVHSKLPEQDEREEIYENLKEDKKEIDEIKKYLTLYCR